MSKYDFMQSNYDFHPNIALQTTTNYFEKEITDGLPFFHQNRLQSTLRNNYMGKNKGKSNSSNKSQNTKLGDIYNFKK